MDITVVRTFFMWCTVINLVMMTVAFVMIAVAGDLAYRVHSKWYPIERSQFNAIVYALLGLYKSLWMILCLVPYLALVIMG